MRWRHRFVRLHCVKFFLLKGVLVFFCFCPTTHIRWIRTIAVQSAPTVVYRENERTFCVVIYRVPNGPESPSHFENPGLPFQLSLVQYRSDRLGIRNRGYISKLLYTVPIYSPQKALGTLAPQFPAYTLYRYPQNITGVKSRAKLEYAK